MTQDAIRALYRAWLTAIETGTVEALLGPLTDDVILNSRPRRLHPESAAARSGRCSGASIRATRRKSSITSLRLEVSGDFALARIPECATVRPSPGHFLRRVNLGNLRRQEKRSVAHCSRRESPERGVSRRGPPAS